MRDNSTFARVLWVISGVLLIAAGVYCLCRPDIGYGTVPVLLAVFMLVAGAVDLVIFGRTHNLLFGSGWLLMDGLLTILFALLLLTSPAVSSTVLPFMFGVWLLSTGVSCLVSSFDLRLFGVLGWGWFTGLGAVMTVLGMLCFFEPVVGAMTMGVLVGLAFIAEGVMAVLHGAESRRMLR